MKLRLILGRAGSLHQLIKKLVSQFNPQANGSDNKDVITADTK